MRVIITKDYEEMTERAARFVARAIKNKADLVLGLSTGRTPVGLYKELIRLHKEEGLDFSKVRTFNLDEYYGLSPEHPSSYRSFMFNHLFNHININPKNIHIPNGLATAVPAYCKEYEEEIKKQGGVDLQILGIGRDGHIGFNEPGSSLGSRTRVKTLAPQTIKDYARFFKREEEVPHYALTMGVGTIMEAKQLLLLASSRTKARILARALEGPVTSDVPASIIQMHPQVIVIADEAAARNLKRKKYHKYVEKNWLSNV